MKKIAGFGVVLLAIASASGFVQAQDDAPPTARATAEIMNTEGKNVGNAVFTQTGNGVEVQLNLSGFEAADASLHGLHIHQVGKCKPTFDAAGDHFNPLGNHHGYLNRHGSHAGDLPNVWIEANGKATYAYTTKLITLKGGERAILDADGAAIMIHAGPDDYLTGTSGSSGDPVACGVITAS